MGLIEASPERPEARDETPPSGLSPLLFLGVAVASLGGPLALVALSIPSISAGPSPLGWMALAATLLFAFPLLIWCRYARRVWGPGGLYSFVEAAAGRWPARVQGTVWIVSYGLYVVYTVPYVVYDLLPAVLPGIGAYQPALEIALPAVIAGATLLPIRYSAGALGVGAALQLALVLALAVAATGHLGGPRPALLGGGLPAFALGSAQISLLYVCGGLPVFLGGEVRSPARTVPRGLATALAGAGAATVLSLLALVAAGIPVASEAPGVEVAAVLGGRPLALAVGLGVALSSTSLILLELLALARVLGAMAGLRPRPTSALLGAGMVGACALALINPLGAYELLLRPSLVALWISQFIVFAVYPAFARRAGRLTALDLVATVVASALTLFGLYSVVALPVSG